MQNEAPLKHGDIIPASRPATYTAPLGVTIWLEPLPSLPRMYRVHIVPARVGNPPATH